MFRKLRRRRRGFTLLELVVTTSLVGITVAAVASLMRSTVAVWDAYESDRARLDQAHAIVRHFVRGLRQANAVTAITDGANVNGDITVTTVDNQTASWNRNGSSLRYTLNGVANVICSSGSALSFQGLRIDGTPTNTPAEVRAVRISVTVTLDRDVSSGRTLTSTAWLRVKT